MSAEPIKTPVPICEACWVKENAQWEPESMDGSGNILMRLKGIPLPEMYMNSSVENCSECSSITIVGIYKNVEPEVVFPNQDEAQ